MRGFWKRPTSRTYSYNLEVGEHYYSPMTSYLESERGSRGETPGALTFSERLARKWIHGRHYDASELRDRYARSASVARGEAALSYLESEMAARSGRAMSVARGTSSELRSGSHCQTRGTAAHSLSSQRQQLLQSSQEASSAKQCSSSAASYSSSSVSVSQQQQQQQQHLMSSVSSRSSRRIEDDVCKKVADIRMMPWSDGPELNEAQAASARARARILELERELDEITKKALTTGSRALKTAKQMAAEAYLEDEQAMAASSRKSKKVIIESSHKIGQA